MSKTQAFPAKLNPPLPLPQMNETPHPLQPYQNLLERSRQASLVGTTSALLEWDQETYMPPRAVDYRARQLAWLDGQHHRLLTAPEVGDWISACEDHAFSDDSDEAANLRCWRRDYDRATRLPAELVEEKTHTKATAHAAWIDARKKSDFSLFAPHLEKIVALQLRSADLYGFEQSRYDALIEDYEPGTRASTLSPLLAELKQGIAEVLPSALERSARIPERFIKGHYPVAEQIAFNRKVVEAFGLDPDASRIDTSTHPFCTGLGPHDCRLTTRYDESDFTSSLTGTMHECGHALYTLGLPAQACGTPLGSDVSLGIHESQSRFWENHVGRSPAFWEHWLPIAARHFKELSRFTPEQLTSALNRVAPTHIRVDADEVTYDLHVILRFEIEQRLINDALPVADIPALWNETFRDMLGIPVDHDANGCLQDVHWSLGLFGYFPTYSLGNIIAAQLHDAALREDPSLGSSLQKADYAPMLTWLRQHIHAEGRRYSPDELVRRATLAAPDASHRITYLKAKYSA